MSTYEGIIIRNRLKIYFNPTHEISGENTAQRTPVNINTLLPHSEHHNIVLDYDPHNQEETNMVAEWDNKRVRIVFDPASRAVTHDWVEDCQYHYAGLIHRQVSDKTVYALSAKNLSDTNSITILDTPADPPQEPHEPGEAAETPQCSNTTETPADEAAAPDTRNENQQRLEELLRQLEDARNALGIAGDIEQLKKEKQALQEHIHRLTDESSSLETQFEKMTRTYHEKMVNISFDGFMASKMLRAAADWETENTVSQQRELLDKISHVTANHLEPDELIDYLCRTIQIARDYDRNTIINLAICMTQGFLTVFSGEPGCGKTSICNILGNVLGLNRIAGLSGCDDRVNRFVTVPVERGWTSKRDFVGYYNPLTKTFDKSNRQIYDALCQLDAEQSQNRCTLPYLILLDEANLSPMEYYWSDFMRLCDNTALPRTVNLGENYIFRIPENLHFVATINNDHTTETLSPRLIDRSWIVTLPGQEQKTLKDDTIPPEKIRVVSWESLRNAFIFNPDDCNLPGRIGDIYQKIISLLKEQRFPVSPRIDHAIKHYWKAASTWMEGSSPDITALDYAVAQRILPKIAGSGEQFEEWLGDFQNLCNDNGLRMSVQLLSGIIARGNDQMKYYQFFC